MKKISCFITLTFFIVSCSSKKEEAIIYNNNLVNKQIKLVNLIDKLDECFQDTNCNVKILYDSLCRTTINYIDSLKTIDNFEGDSTLKVQFKNLLSLYRKVIENDYKQLIDLYFSIDSLDFNEDTIKLLEKRAKILYDSINNKIKSANDRFIVYQKKFAEKYGFKLY